MLCQSREEEWNYLLVLCDSVRDEALVFLNMICRLISFVLLFCCLHYQRTISFWCYMPSFFKEDILFGSA
jgi:hypothetical protein